MFESILIKVETKQRTYCCGGGWQNLWQGRVTKHWEAGMAKYFGGRDGKLFLVMRWLNIFGKNLFSHPPQKNNLPPHSSFIPSTTTVCPLAHPPPSPPPTFFCLPKSPQKFEEIVATQSLPKIFATLPSPPKKLYLSV